MAGQGYDWRDAEPRWQERWREADVYTARADAAREPYFVNVPYPYVDGLLHLGFGYTFLHADIMARYQRMRGRNVLFPQGFHCTGLPILGAAQRVAEGEEGQLQILREMGFAEAEIPAFEDPDHWIATFPEECRKDLERFGAAVDWSRTFITTDRNPPYDAFVRWQFRRLREKDAVRLGEHPVIWCPRDEIPIGDHDRYEGEGETPVEYTLMKFRLMQRYLVAATLRPETVFGTTNVWVDPEVEYVDAQVGGERWIVNPAAVAKLRAQGWEVEERGRVQGADLVGQSCVTPVVGDPVLILPSTFIDQDMGTGIVSSVPADAPDDWVALKELQADDETLIRYHLDAPFVRSLEPIPIIDLPGYGPMPALDVVARMGIESQDERAALQEAKEEVYREEYYRGTMNDRCGDVAGLPVEEAKERVKAQMLEGGQAEVLYEPSGPVICRCLTRAVVKVVENQWFLAYGDPDWKEEVHGAVDGMTHHPDAIRKQFHHVVDWLRDWACVHHQGLGTRLPWDANWVIESLSDSTLYMAYYTVAHVLQGADADPSRLDDALFDYVFLGLGDAKRVAADAGLPGDRLEAMREEFRYWYPFDLRISAKDLVFNHLSFCLFNHTALFPEEAWPRGFAVNGYLSVEGGEKMSKSRGGAIYIREALEEWGADATRLTLAQGGEGLDDPTFDVEFAASVGRRLATLYGDLTEERETRTDERPVDAGFRSVLQRAVQATTEAMEGLRHRTALKHGYFDLRRAWSWYFRRCHQVPHASLLEEYREVQTKLLAPFVPHLAEEAWEALGRAESVVSAPYPTADEAAVDPRAEASEDYLRDALDDVRQILKATGIVPERVVFYTAPAWKRRVYEAAVALREKDDLEVGALIQRARDAVGGDASAKEIASYAKALVQEVRERGSERLERLSWTLDETSFLQDAAPFLEAELGAAIEVYQAETERSYDPKSKAGLAVPWRPAIYVE